MATRLSNPAPRFFDSSAVPLTGGKLNFYEPGTTTRKTTYSDAELTTPNTNPVILSAGGMVPNIFLDGPYRVILTDENDVQVFDRDDVNDGAGDALGLWSASVTYGVDNVVYASDNNYYISLVSNNLGNNPISSPSEWAQVEFLKLTAAQAALLEDIAALTPTDSNIIVGDGTTWVAESGATARASLGLTIGTNVQAWAANLDQIAALAVTDSNIIVGNGTAWVAESGATARTSLGVGTGDSPQFTGLTLTGSLSVQGNTTIGNASGDALTFHPAAWTLTNAVTITGTWTNLGAVTTVDINGGTGDNFVLGATTPAVGTVTKLTVLAGTSGAAASGLADDLVIQNSSNAGLSILTPDASTSNLYFGSATDNIGAFLTYGHNVNLFSIGTSKVGASLRLNSDDGVQHLTLTGGVGSLVGTFAGRVVATGFDGTLGATTPAAATVTTLNASSTATVAGIVNTATTILQSTNTANHVFSGGNASSSGANWVLYGGAHASAANDATLRSGSNTVLGYDDSANLFWIPSDNFVVGTTTFDGADGFSAGADGSVRIRTPGANVVPLIVEGKANYAYQTFQVNGNPIGYIGDATGIVSGSGAGTMALRGELGIRFGVSFALGMNLTSTGLGVGGITPVDKLHVDGGGTFFTSSSDRLLIVPLTAGSGVRLSAVNAANSAYANMQYEGSQHIFYNAGSESARLVSGNAMVGTTTYQGAGGVSLGADGSLFASKGASGATPTGTSWTLESTSSSALTLAGNATSVMSIQWAIPADAIASNIFYNASTSQFVLGSHILGGTTVLRGGDAVTNLTLSGASGSQLATFAGTISVDGTTDSTSGTTGSIHTDGGIGAVKDIVTDASFVAGTGIQLGGTGSANLLDDYEEGTFTPVIADAASGGNTGSASQIVGNYVKVGAMVTVNISITDVNKAGMTAGNLFYIRGLPFTVSGSAGLHTAAPLASGLTFTGYVVAQAVNSSTNIYLSDVSSGGAYSALTVADVATNADIYLSISYQI